MKNKTEKSKKAILIIIIILLVIAVLILLLDKFNVLTNLFNKDVSMGKEENVLKEYETIAKYIQIKNSTENDGKYNFEFFEFKENLDSKVYENFLENQNEFMKYDEAYYKKELKSFRGMHGDILMLASIATHYIEDMPVFDEVSTLYIDTIENKEVSLNDIIGAFDYNLEGLLNKMLEDLLENSKTNSYILPNGDYLGKEEFKENIPTYAQQLSQLDFPSIFLYLDNVELCMSYIESNVLSYINVDHTTMLPVETVKTINLEII